MAGITETCVDCGSRITQNVLERAVFHNRYKSRSPEIRSLTTYLQQTEERNEINEMNVEYESGSTYK